MKNIKEYQKEYQLKNKDKIREQRKEYYKLHKSENIIRVRNWRKEQDKKLIMTPVDQLNIKQKAKRMKLIEKSFTKIRFFKAIDAIHKKYSNIERRQVEVTKLRKKLNYYE